MISEMKPAETLTIEADVNQLARVRHFVMATASHLSPDTNTINDLILALTEAVTNVIVHGYQNAPDRSITITVGGTPEKLVMVLCDSGPPFDPTTIPAPDMTLPLEKRRPGGMGVHLIRHFTDEIHYRRTSSGENELTLMKKTEMYNENQL